MGRDNGGRACTQEVLGPEDLGSGDERGREGIEGSRAVGHRLDLGYEALFEFLTAAEQCLTFVGEPRPRQAARCKRGSGTDSEQAGSAHPGSEGAVVLLGPDLGGAPVVGA